MEVLQLKEGDRARAQGLVTVRRAGFPQSHPSKSRGQVSICILFLFKGAQGPAATPLRAEGEERTINCRTASLSDHHCALSTGICDHGLGLRAPRPRPVCLPPIRGLPALGLLALAHRQLVPPS